MIGKALMAEYAFRAVDLAGGAGFCRSAWLKRRLRDIQGARYRPPQRGVQPQNADAMALEKPVAQIYWTRAARSPRQNRGR
jgi:indole-3-acetate monooxygenase